MNSIQYACYRNSGTEVKTTHYLLSSVKATIAQYTPNNMKKKKALLGKNFFRTKKDLFVFVYFVHLECHPFSTRS